MTNIVTGYVPWAQFLQEQ